jgi:hypothetical protein
MFTQLAEGIALNWGNKKVRGENIQGFNLLISFHEPLRKARRFWQWGRVSDIERAHRYGAYWLTQAAVSLLEGPRIHYLHINSQHFKDPGGLLPCSQRPSHVPCPEPEESSPSNRSYPRFSWCTYLTYFWGTL